MTRIFYVFLLLSIFWACKPASKEVPQTSQKETPYFFWSVDWHPNKELLVVGGMQDTLRFFSATNLQLIKNVPYKGTITKVKWHPTQNKVAVSVQDQKSKLAIFDFDTDEQIQLDSISNNSARAIGWNHSGEI